LTQLSINAKKAMDDLSKQHDTVERILKTAELCRRLETEREKVLPF